MKKLKNTESAQLCLTHNCQQKVLRTRWLCRQGKSAFGNWTGVLLETCSTALLIQWILGRKMEFPWMKNWKTLLWKSMICWEGPSASLSTFSDKICVCVSQYGTRVSVSVSPVQRRQPHQPRLLGLQHWGDYLCKEKLWSVPWQIRRETLRQIFIRKWNYE